MRATSCEKALTTSAGDALAVLAAAEESRAVVVEAFMYRFHPAIRTVTDLIAAGQVGEIESVRAGFCMAIPEESSPDDPLRDWRQRKESGGGIPYDLTCYCVDACNRFTGAVPRRVLALGSRSRRYDTINRLYGLIEYENGRIGVVLSSSTSHFDHELRISGTLGHINLPVAWRIETPIGVIVRRSRERWGKFAEEHHAIEYADPFRLQLERFAAVVRGRANPAPTLLESFLTAATLEALVRSAEESGPVDVEIPAAISARL